MKFSKDQFLTDITHNLTSFHIILSGWDSLFPFMLQVTTMLDDFSPL